MSVVEKEEKRRTRMKGEESQLAPRSCPAGTDLSRSAIEVGSLSLFEFSLDTLKIHIGPKHVALLADPGGPQAALSRFDLS